jgi:hypothetical protein
MLTSVCVWEAVGVGECVDVGVLQADKYGKVWLCAISANHSAHVSLPTVLSMLQAVDSSDAIALIWVMATPMLS